MCVLTLYKSNTLGIVHQPQFKIIPLNTVQKYYCSGIATLIKWHINGKPSELAPGVPGFEVTSVTVSDGRIPTLQSSELTVLGNNVTNNSMIICYAVVLYRPYSYAASNSVQILVLDNLGIDDGDDGDALGDVFISQIVQSQSIISLLFQLLFSSRGLHHSL